MRGYDYVANSSGLNNLHKLGKLRRLSVDVRVCENILDHLKFGVFEDLEELQACFQGASLESIQEMKRIIPNLKKIEIHIAAFDTILDLLETLDNLEALKIVSQWKSTEKVYPKIKILQVEYVDFNAVQLQKQFPNLEFLMINSCYSKAKELVPFLATLLSGLKQLKTLYMEITTGKRLDPKFVLQCLQEYGNHLQDVNFVFRSGNPKIDRLFAIEKRPRSSFCIINKENSSLDAEWMRKIF